MIPYEIREKLQNITNGIVLEGGTDYCSTIRNQLIKSFSTGATAKNKFESKSVIKEKQTHFLKSYAIENNLWMENLPDGSQYLTRGGESTIYLAADNLNVLKVNDGIYYASWDEYFNSLLIHNLLFPNTAYKLLGFTEEKDRGICAILSQPFIEGTQAHLDDIKELLMFNGFENTRRQDYLNKQLGLLLEDMHDENVIAKDDLLFFIDTVFYVI